MCNFWWSAKQACEIGSSIILILKKLTLKEVMCCPNHTAAKCLGCDFNPGLQYLETLSKYLLNEWTNDRYNKVRDLSRTPGYFLGWFKSVVLDIGCALEYMQSFSKISITHLSSIESEAIPRHFYFLNVPDYSHV